MAYLKLEFSDSELFDDAISFSQLARNPLVESPAEEAEARYSQNATIFRMTHDLAGNASDSVSVGRVLEHANEDDDGLSEEGGQPADEGEPSGCVPGWAGPGGFSCSWVL